MKPSVANASAEHGIAATAIARAAGKAKVTNAVEQSLALAPEHAP